MSYWQTKAHHLPTHQPEIIAELYRTDTPEPTPERERPIPSPTELRGIPAIGRGVQGAIPSTAPGRY